MKQNRHFSFFLCLIALSLIAFKPPQTLASSQGGSWVLERMERIDEEQFQNLFCSQDEKNQWLTHPIPFFNEELLNTKKITSNTSQKVQNLNDFELSADSITGRKEGQFKAEGDVIASNGTESIWTQSAIIDNTNQTLTTLGQSYFEDAYGKMSTQESLVINQAQNTLEIKAPKVVMYELNASVLSDFAYKKNQKTRFENIIYTHCNPTQPTWKIKASEAILDPTNQTLETKNLWLLWQDFPLLYLPKLSIPLAKRASGWLVPTYRYRQRQGFSFNELNLPYYWNIAPNYDATTYLRLNDYFGQSVGQEFRYLSPPHRGYIYAEGLLLDKNEKSAERHYLRWQNSYKGDGSLEDWQIQWDLSQVSDESYLQDFQTQQRDDISVLESTFSIDNLQSDHPFTQELTLLKADKLATSSQNALVKPFKWKGVYHNDLTLPDIGEVDWSYQIQHENFETPFVQGDRKRKIERTYQKIDFQNQVKKNHWTLQSQLSFIAQHYENHKKANSQNAQTLQSDFFKTHSIASFNLEGLFEQTKPSRVFNQDLKLKSFLNVPITSKQNDTPLLDTSVTTPSYSRLFKPNRYAGFDRINAETKLSFAAEGSVKDREDQFTHLDWKLGAAYYFNEDENGYISGEETLWYERGFSNLFAQFRFNQPFSSALSSILNKDFNPYKPPQWRVLIETEHDGDAKNGWIDPVSKRLSLELDLSQNQSYALGWFRDENDDLLDLSAVMKSFQSEWSIGGSYDVAEKQWDNISLNWLQNDCCTQLGLSLEKQWLDNDEEDLEFGFFVHFIGLGNLSSR